jgi:hypothetical protein
VGFYLYSRYAHDTVGRAVMVASSNGQSQPTQSATPAYLPTPLTLRDLYDTDFEHYEYRTDGSFTFTSLDKTRSYNLQISLLIDFGAKSMFIAAFIPNDIDPQTALYLGVALAQRHQHIAEELNHQTSFAVRIPGDTSGTSSKDATFSGRIYIYCGTDFSQEQLAALERFYKQNHLALAGCGKTAVSHSII